MNKIYIVDVKSLQSKIKRIKHAGKDSFHVISDFDATLTRGYEKGKKIPSSYSLIDQGNYFSQKTKQELQKMFDTYHPLEIDTHLSLATKKKKMDEWWSEHYSLMVKEGISRQVFQDVIAKEHIPIRDNFPEFCNLLAQNKIPLLIFSAGQGNLIQEYLRTQELLMSNLHIISNFYTFNKQGKATGYTTPQIHTFNKSEIVLKQTPYFSEITQRPNVILLGDSLADSEMAQGLDHDIVIRIGFCNHNQKELMENYAKVYDVVILDDGDLSYIIDLLTELIT